MSRNLCCSLRFPEHPRSEDFSIFFFLFARVSGFFHCIRLICDSFHVCSAVATASLWTQRGAPLWALYIHVLALFIIIFFLPPVDYTTAPGAGGQDEQKLLVLI